MKKFCRALLHPLCLLKYFEIIFAVLTIVALDWTYQHVGKLTISVSCKTKDGYTEPRTLAVNYPLNVTKLSFCAPTYDVYKNSVFNTANFNANIVDMSEILVVTTVMSIAYSIMAFTIYFAKPKIYRPGSILVDIDIMISFIFIGFWIVSNMIWCSSVSKLRRKTDFDPFVTPTNNTTSDVGDLIKIIDYPSYNLLGIVIAFGFANAYIWYLNVAYLYMDYRYVFYSAHKSNDIHLPDIVLKEQDSLEYRPNADYDDGNLHCGLMTISGRRLNAIIDMNDLYDQETKQNGPTAISREQKIPFLNSNQLYQIEN